MVHPVLILLIMIILILMIIIEGMSIQNLKLLIRGNVVSLSPFIRGINQFLNLPMVIGMVMKKIIINAWIVIIMLKIELLFVNLFICISSIRMIILIDVPMIPDQMPIIKYMIPIFLWLVDIMFFIDKVAD
jgi:hypothetical protein